eukprot:jgi/Ulvmu1/2216/UM013_0062.1
MLSHLDMGWCTGDDVVAIGLTSCVVDTLTGTFLLVLTGIGLLVYLILLKMSTPRQLVVKEEERVRTSIVFAAVGCLLLTHLVSLTLDILMAPDVPDEDNILHIHPARLFCGGAFMITYVAVLLLLVLGHSNGLPVPNTTVCVVALGIVYVTQTMYMTADVEKQTSTDASVVIGCVQCLVVVIIALFEYVWRMRASNHTEVHEPLLPNGRQAASAGPARRTKPERAWYAALGDCLVYVWPKRALLQLAACTCILLLILIRLLNLAVPIFYGRTVDVLSKVADEARHGTLPHHTGQVFAHAMWPWVILYLLGRFLQGGGGVGGVGLISTLRSYLWIPISQDAERRISVEFFEHLLYLDLTFHLKRKTGELIRVLDRGTSSMRVLLESMLFSIGPAMFDVVAAATLLYSKQAWIAAIVLVSVLFYVPVTIIITEYRGEMRREMNTLDNKVGSKVTDALLNFETVKYFTNEDLEVQSYGSAITAYQRSERALLVSLNVLNVVQALIMFAGISTGMTVCVHEVVRGNLSVGDSVLFLTLMSQIYAPLNFFGSYYRQIQRNMIDMENMFELLAESGAVEDSRDAVRFELKRGDIEFWNVSFSYKPDRTILRRVSFCVPGGGSVAFVGATGSGKSTVLRLLFRFYDPTTGAVYIDGQDLRAVTQASFREHIAVVPQDTVLFNDSIFYNIAYGCPSAGEEEVHAAARAASLHDSIMSRFPEQYDTVVGERGLRLSGGEKQRVAFARAILKNPAILILDEATSALDSLTERDIHACLAGMKATRTMVSVAHRLSSVMEADEIVVMDDGAVCERGSHGDLVAAGGLYATMWSRQLASPSVDDLAGARSGAASPVPPASPVQQPSP